MVVGGNALRWFARRKRAQKSRGRIGPRPGGKTACRRPFGRPSGLWAVTYRGSSIGHSSPPSESDRKPPTLTRTIPGRTLFPTALRAESETSPRGLRTKRRRYRAFPTGAAMGCAAFSPAIRPSLYRDVSSRGPRHEWRVFARPAGTPITRRGRQRAEHK